MKAVAKGLLTAIITSISLLVLMNMVYFMPWYMTLVSETFNISQVVATNNYLKHVDRDDALIRIKDRPIFKENPASVIIEVKHSDGSDAIGGNDPSAFFTAADNAKPYEQRGESIDVTLYADYHLSVRLWGTDYSTQIPVSFSLSTSGLRHYKDLPE